MQLPTPFLRPLHTFPYPLSIMTALFSLCLPLGWQVEAAFRYTPERDKHSPHFSYAKHSPHFSCARCTYLSREAPKAALYTPKNLLVIIGPRSLPIGDIYFTFLFLSFPCDLVIEMAATDRNTQSLAPSSIFLLCPFILCEIFLSRLVKKRQIQ